MAVSRQDLEAGRVREFVRGTPLAPLLLSDGQLEASLADALAGFGDDDVWLFGYGSLIWNPMVQYAEMRAATLHGYHRGFYLRSRVNRGTHDRPGLVLALDRGGTCRGVAFRLERHLAADELRVLWRREMLLGSYMPRHLAVRAGGERLRALAFVIDRSASGYAGRLAEREILDALRRAHGLYGGGAEYLVRTVEGLLQHGIHDRRLLRLKRMLEEGR